MQVIIVLIFEPSKQATVKLFSVPLMRGGEPQCATRSAGEASCSPRARG